MKHEAEPIISWGKAYIPTPIISFGNAVKNFYAKYFDFKSRARRSEFWWAFLYVLIAEFVLVGIFTFLNLNFEDLFFHIADIFLFGIPLLALSVRRLHDMDKSGWYIFIALIPLIGGIILFFWWIKNSTVGLNNWGVSPKYSEVEISDDEV